MHKVLLPVDGSDSAYQATLYVIDFFGSVTPKLLHLANVPVTCVKSQPSFR